MNLCFALTDSSQRTMAKVLIESFLRSSSENQIWIYLKQGIDFSYMDESVSIHQYDVNQDFYSFPFYDKIQAGAICEQSHAQPFLWVDVDSVFFHISPKDFQLPICINPVDKKNIGIKADDPISDFWTYILKDIGLSKNDYKRTKVTTTISKEFIYPYYNIGMVYLDPSLLIFSNTLKVMKKLLNTPEFQTMLMDNPLNQIFLHQAVFSALVIKFLPSKKISYLKEGYNMPMHLLDEEINTLKERKFFSIRYDTYFHDHKWPDTLDKPCKIDEQSLQMKWIYNLRKKDL